MRTLSNIPRVADLILDAAINAPKDDPFYDFAAWLSVNDLAPQVAEWVEKNATAGTASAGAPNGDGHASGRAGLQPAVPGILPGTPDGNRPAKQDAPAPNEPRRAPSANERTPTPGAPGRIPGAAGNIPALPGNAAQPADKSPSASAAEQSAIRNPQSAIASRDAKITLALQSLPPETSGPLLAKIIAARGLPRDGSGPWIELIGQSGGPKELRTLLAALIAEPFDRPAQLRALAALETAARRGAKPQAAPPGAGRKLTHEAEVAIKNGNKSPHSSEEEDYLELLVKRWAGDSFNVMSTVGAEEMEHSRKRDRAVWRLFGAWKLDFAAPALATRAVLFSSDKTGDGAKALIETLRDIGTQNAIGQLRDLATDKVLPGAVNSDYARVRRHAAAALAAVDFKNSTAIIHAILTEPRPEAEALQLWRDVLASKSAGDALAAKLPALTKEQAAPALRAARELGKKGQPLVAKLAPLAGEKATAPSTGPANYADLAARAKKDGDPVAGEALYRRTASACVTCHAIGGAGGKLGPDMTSIGASAPLDYIVESILDPAAKVKEGYHAFSFAMKDGSEAIGIPTRETAQEQFIRTLAGEQGLPKANIVSKKIAEGGASLMPPGLTAAWTDRERLNLYAFLGELGRPGPFDASKNNVARVWMLTDHGATKDALEPLQPTSGPGGSGGLLSIPAYTLVDGRLTRDLLAEKIAMLAPKHDAVHLTARFQSAAGKTKFNLTGIRKAWLDGQPLAIASEPSPSVELTAGVHTFTIEVDTKNPPEVLRLESPTVSFLGE